MRHCERKYTFCAWFFFFFFSIGEKHHDGDVRGRGSWGGGFQTGWKKDAQTTECPSSTLVEVIVCDTKMDLLRLQCDDDVTKAHHCIVCHVMNWRLGSGAKHS